jgi:hypothetical protein
MRTSYRHRQTGSGSLLVTGLGIAVILLLAVEHGPHPALMGALAVLVLFSVVFSSLTVMITPSSLVFWFGPGVLRKTVPLADIASLESVRSPWYYGVGWRITPRGMLYSVSGFSAVEITGRDGSRFRLGTDEPERLRAALAQAVTRLP